MMIGRDAAAPPRSPRLVSCIRLFEGASANASTARRPSIDIHLPAELLEGAADSRHDAIRRVCQTYVNHLAVTLLTT